MTKEVKVPVTRVERARLFRTRDFKSLVSTDSTTPACHNNIAPDRNRVKKTRSDKEIDFPVLRLL